MREKKQQIFLFLLFCLSFCYTCTISVSLRGVKVRTGSYCTSTGCEKKNISSVPVNTYTCTLTHTSETTEGENGPPEHYIQFDQMTTHAS